MVDQIRSSSIKFIEYNFVTDHFYYSGLSKLHNSSLFIGSSDYLTNRYHKMGIDINISCNHPVTNVDYTTSYEIQLSHKLFEIIFYRDTLILQSKINPTHYEELSIYREFSYYGNPHDISTILRYSI